MDETIRVHVVKYPDRKNFVMRYMDPTTNRQVQRSTCTASKKEASKVAAKWEAELQEGRYSKPTYITWEEFREHHYKHILSGMKASTAGAYDSSLNVFERLVNPKRLTDLTTARMTAFATALRDQGRSAATVARHLRHLKVVFRWAQRQGMLLKLPEIEMPKQVKGMRGRPITLEEFERMLEATPKVDGQSAAPSWQFYLRGLWASGLRLEESLTLRWDDAPGAIVVDLVGRRPMLRIPAEAEKGGRHRLLPITPEFAELLETVPESHRHGRGFRPIGKHGKPLGASRHMIGPKVTLIGRAAGVVTAQREKKGEVVKEFAGAHDLRRSFGFRWSRRMMPAVLKELMRHSKIETTMTYYVGQNAEATADELWRISGTTSGTIAESAEAFDSENAIS
jgi:integrase